MPKEAVIRKKAIEILEKERWIVWWPAKVKFRQTDIFGIFDLICWKKNIGNFKLIQLTTVSNLSARRKKISNFFKENKMNLRRAEGVETEIWAWGQSQKAFKVETV